MNKWIPISKRTPEKGGYYLTTTMLGEVYCDYWNGVAFDRSETVIAWQKLPAPFKPQERDDENCDDIWERAYKERDSEPQPSKHTEERTETHECDYISRQFMYDMGATCIAARNKDGDLVALGALDILPSVNLQPKAGHWIGHREHCEKLGVIPSGLGVYEWCSNCGHGIDIRDWSRIGHSYCPECGAKMQEVQE